MVNNTDPPDGGNINPPLRRQRYTRNISARKEQRTIGRGITGKVHVARRQTRAKRRNCQKGDLSASHFAGLTPRRQRVRQHGRE